jgi:N-ethylmaleimide reductase
MTRSRAGPGDAATALMAQYYAQRASAGLVIAEASQISPEAQGYLRTPGIHSADQIKGWQSVTHAVHKEGGTIVLQLWHVGRVSHPGNRLPATRSVAPSALAPAISIFTATGPCAAPVPHALDAVEIAGIRDDYARAARNALEAGFDGVEIHAGNGYLIDQFLHDSANRRSDQYGGSTANRCQLLFEVCDRVAREIGGDRTGVRLSPFGVFNDVDDTDPQALFATAITGLGARQLAYLHVINVEASGDRTSSGAAVNVARFTREHYKRTLIVGGGYTPASAAAVIEAGDADMVAFGRPFIANPDLVNRIREGHSLASATRATFYTEGPVGYTDYPVAMQDR